MGKRKMDARRARNVRHGLILAAVALFFFTYALLKFRLGW